MNVKLEYINTKVKIKRLKSILLTLYAQERKLKSIQQRDSIKGVGQMMIDHIKFLMQSNLTSTQIANGANISTSTVSQIRKNHREITNLTIKTGCKLDNYYYYLRA